MARGDLLLGKDSVSRQQLMSLNAVGNEKWAKLGPKEEHLTRGDLLLGKDSIFRQRLAEFLKTYQNGPEYWHRDLAIARFLVSAVRKIIGSLLSWSVSLSSSVAELTRLGLERGLHVNP